MAERLQKLLAAAGFGSRRSCEQLIVEGRVRVNGHVVTELGSKAEESDRVTVNGRTVSQQKHTYLLMNKPVGYVTTVSDPRARQTVMELLPKLGVQLHPVGRLDKDTEGALIFTNDGELTNRLTHPRYGVEKVYRALVLEDPTEDRLERVRAGVWLSEGKTAPAKVRVLGANTREGGTALEITIGEGKNREVRRILAAVGLTCKKLKRTRIGNLSTFKLPRGYCRMLTKVELNKLKKMVGLD